MTLRRAVAAVLARIRPARGRHAELQADDDTLVFPKLAPDPDEVPPSWMTRLDLPPRIVRPYIDPDDKES